MRWPTILLAVSFLFASTRAPAEASAEDKAMADALFQDGRKLFKEGKFSEACRKFEASQKIDPAPGTLLNLGACHFEEGKFATAYVELEEAASRARKDKRDDRLQVANDYLAQLQDKLTRISIKVSSAADVAGLEITFDGRSVVREAWGVPFPVDPGVHTVTAKAVQRSPWTATIEVGKTAETKSIDVPMLVASSEQPAMVVAPKSESASPLRTIGWVTAGGGVASAGVGTFFLLRSNSIRSDAESIYASGDADGANTRNSDARSARTLAWIGFGVGGAAIAAGITMILVRPREESPQTGWTFAPAVGQGGGGVSLQGVF